MSGPIEPQIRSVYSFLEKSGFSYLIIGGLAGSVLGEPRLTVDCDILLFVKPEEISKFLSLAKAAGFNFDAQKAEKDAKDRLCFEMKLEGLHVDCLIAATAFEAEALSRRLVLPLGDMKVSFPSPEDFIVLKLLVGRDKDMLDAKNVAARHFGKLDLKYIRGWVDTLSQFRKDQSLKDRLAVIFP